MHCEINVILVFHKILWKKNFTVYPFLNCLRNHYQIIKTFSNHDISPINQTIQRDNKTTETNKGSNRQNSKWKETENQETYNF